MRNKFLLVLHLVLSLVVVTVAKKEKNNYEQRNLQVSNCPQQQYISLDGNNCVPNCQQNEFISAAGNRCIRACPQSQVFFTNPNRCAQSCGQGLIKQLSGQACVGTCNQGQFISVGQSQCLASCLQGQVIQNNRNCHTQCPDRQVFLAADGVTCVGSCSSISQLISAASQSKCVSSCSGQELISSDGSSCTDQCVYTQFSNIGRCFTQCPQGLFGNPLTRSCGSTCPNGFYNDQAQRVCRKCNSNCATCSGAADTQCLSCHAGATFDSNTGRCISVTCQPGSFLVGSACLPCNESCLTCSSQNFCTSCFDDFLPQSDGTCITCRANQYFTPGGCLECPVSYDAANALPASAKASALAVCEIKMNRAQVNSQLTSTLSTSFNSVTNLSEGSSSKDVSQNSRALIQLSLSLVSKLQDDEPFAFQTADLAVAAQPIKEGQDFALAVAKPTADNPNPSKVEMPAAIASIFKDAKVVAMQTNQPLFNNPKIGNFQPPVLSIEIKRRSDTQAVQTLAQPIKLTLFAKSTQALAGRFYNTVTSQWTSQGIETNQRTLADGTIEVQVITRHLTSFSVGVAPPPPTVMDLFEADMQGVHIALGLTITLIVIILVLAQILDCLKKPRYYPHENEQNSNYNFRTVFKYSLLYNLPWFYFFSYRDKSIPNFAKGLWLSMMYLVLLLFSFMFFMPDLINGSVGGTAVFLSLFLALILLPNSLLIKIIRVKTDQPPPIEIIEGAFGSKSDLTEDVRKKSMKQSEKPKQLYQVRKIGAVLLLAIAVLVAIIGIIGIFFIGKKIVDDKNSNRLAGVIGTFFASVIIGYGYGVLKILVGSHVAMNSEKSRNWIKFLFLDVLTQEVVEYFQKTGGAPHRRSHKYIEEAADDMPESQTGNASKRPSKKKKKKKKKND